MVLVDTSVWVDHLQRGDKALAGLLLAGQVAGHPFVIGELACGRIRNRAEVLSLLQTLPAVPRATDAEVLDFIEQHHVMGEGLGLIDVHLLASCLLAGTRLWTRDKSLSKAAARVGIAAG